MDVNFINSRKKLILPIFILSGFAIIVIVSVSYMWYNYMSNSEMPNTLGTVNKYEEIEIIKPQDIEVRNVEGVIFERNKLNVAYKGTSKVEPIIGEDVSKYYRLKLDNKGGITGMPVDGKIVKHSGLDEIKIEDKSSEGGPTIVYKNGEKVWETKLMYGAKSPIAEFFTTSDSWVVEIIFILV